MLICELEQNSNIEKSSFKALMYELPGIISKK